MTPHASRGANAAPRCYHLVGVGGVGMSALAQLLLALGHGVSGSDRYYDLSSPAGAGYAKAGQGRKLDILRKLRLQGVRLAPQDGNAVNKDLTAVVVSTAIEDNNPDILAARAKAVPIIHRAEMLAGLARGKTCVAVTGTAGKSTVTGMIGWTLEQLGLDPTVVNGGAVLNWVDGQTPGNFRFGHSDLWVLELDESDRSLLKFSPEYAVITNISKDHFELDEVKSLFAAFAKQVKKPIIGYDPNVSNGVFLGSAPSLTAEGFSFQYGGIDFHLPLLGKHNAENALHCVMLCEKLGLDLNDVSRALAKFAGIERRLEVIGRPGGITVIDDYAHNPAKIAAAWQAVEPLARRITAVWRPHGYGPLALMRRELIDVFSRHVRAQDRIFIMSVYFAGGTAVKEVTARMLADDLKRKGLPVGYVEDYAALQPELLKSVAAGDAFLFMGARDPDLPVFVRRFVLKLNDFIVHRVAGPGGVTEENQSAD